MELLQLKYFCMVARMESVTKAAAELLVSQPSLSKTIRKLEEELGVPLFERRGNHIQLNRMGSIFYDEVRTCLQVLSGGVQKIADLSDDPSGEVHVFVQTAANFLVDLYMNFSKKYPSTRLILSNSPQSDKLQTGDYDIMFSSTERYAPCSGTLPLLTERMALAVPRGHPLAGQKSVSLSEAAPYPFIITDMFNFVQDLCLQAGFVPHIVMQCDNTFTFNYMLEQKRCLSILPQCTIGRAMPVGVEMVPFHSPSSQRTIVLTWNRNRYLSQAATIFRDMAIEYFAEAKKTLPALLDD